MYAIGVCLIGHVLLIVSSVPTVITKPDSSIGVLALGMIVLGLGKSGVQSYRRYTLTTYRYWWLQEQYLPAYCRAAA